MRSSAAKRRPKRRRNSDTTSPKSSAKSRRLAGVAGSKEHNSDENNTSICTLTPSKENIQPVRENIQQQASADDLYKSVPDSSAIKDLGVDDYLSAVDCEATTLNIEPR